MKVISVKLVDTQWTLLRRILSCVDVNKVQKLYGLEPTLVANITDNINKQVFKETQ